MSNAVNRCKGIWLLAGLCAWGPAATAWPAGVEQPRVEYSADQTISSEGRTVESKVYYARDRERMEIRAGGGAQIFITRRDKKVSWVLMPEQKAYTELSLEQSRRNAPRDIRDCSMKMKTAGTETVNGHPATRNDIEAICPDDSRYNGSMWITRDGIPVKIDATSRGSSGKDTRILVELRNLRIGKQDPALFEVPAGYAKYSIPDFGLGAPGGVVGGAAAPPDRAPAERPAPAVSAPDAGRSYTAQPRRTEPASAGSVPTRKKGSADTGRSYTATGRSYTAQPRDAGTPAEGVVDKAIGAGKKLKNLFGW